MMNMANMQPRHILVSVLAIGIHNATLRVMLHERSDGNVCKEDLDKLEDDIQTVVRDNINRGYLKSFTLDTLVDTLNGAGWIVEKTGPVIMAVDVFLITDIVSDRA
jgi:hypothetical protein